jgi:hypothetical protein
MRSRAELDKKSVSTAPSPRRGSRLVGTEADVHAGLYKKTGDIMAARTGERQHTDGDGGVGKPSGTTRSCMAAHRCLAALVLSAALPAGWL